MIVLVGARVSESGVMDLDNFEGEAGCLARVAPPVGSPLHQTHALRNHWQKRTWTKGLMLTEFDQQQLNNTKLMTDTKDLAGEEKIVFGLCGACSWRTCLKSCKISAATCSPL